MANKKTDTRNVIARNRKAGFRYHILDTFEAGIALVGSEVKALRQKNADLSDSYAHMVGGELFLHNLHIGEYRQAGVQQHPPKRRRKLLMHRRELRRVAGKVEERGMTLVPLELYFGGRGFAKVRLGLCKGKSRVDKRHALKEKGIRREIQRGLAGKRKR